MAKKKLLVLITDEPDKYKKYFAQKGDCEIIITSPPRERFSAYSELPMFVDPLITDKQILDTARLKNLTIKK